MDTVTESRLAIEMNKLGGIGVVHKNLSIDDQIEEVKLVKNHIKDINEYKSEYPNILLDNNDKPITGAAIGIDDLS